MYIIMGSDSNGVLSCSTTKNKNVAIERYWELKDRTTSTIQLFVNDDSESGAYEIVNLKRLKNDN